MDERDRCDAVEDRYNRWDGVDWWNWGEKWGSGEKSGEKIWSCRKKVVTLHSQLRDWQRDAICREGRSVENRHRGVEQW